jgi:hypothetical protein
MVDISGSESFGLKNQFKKDIVTEIAATMASATQNNDKIGLIFFVSTKLNSTFLLRRSARFKNLSLRITNFIHKAIKQILCKLKFLSSHKRADCICNFLISCQMVNSDFENCCKET